MCVLLRGAGGVEEFGRGEAGDWASRAVDTGATGYTCNGDVVVLDEVPGWCCAIEAINQTAGTIAVALCSSAFLVGAWVGAGGHALLRGTVQTRRCDATQ